MTPENHQSSLEALQDIRSMMERSARFLSLSGWSGVWAGSVGLVGAFIAKLWLDELPETYYNPYRLAPATTIPGYEAIVTRFMMLALVVLLVALAGGYYFTWRRTRQQGGTLWNSASRRMILEAAIPMAAGGVFSFFFIQHGHEAYIAPACLVFYGLALLNGSKYTLSDIRYLGIMEVALGCICLFVPGYGLSFWAFGFGVLHILYGIIMWNKYDKHTGKTPQP